MRSATIHRPGTVLLALLIIAGATASFAQQPAVDLFATPEWSFVPGAEAPTASAFVSWSGKIFKGTEDRPVSYVRTGAVFSSADGGQTWTHARLGGPITQLLATHHGLVAAVHGMINFSADGRSWEHVNPVGGALSTSLTSIRTTVFAMTGGYDHGRFHRSPDGGQTWEELPLPAFGIAQLEAVGSHLFAGNTDGLFRSIDMGNTWQPVESFPHQPSIMRMAEVDGILFVVQRTTGSGLYRSMDRGETWEFATNGVPNDPYGLLRAITSHDRSLYMSVTASSWQRGLYVSHDLGLSWSRIVIPGLSDQYITAVHSEGSALIAGTPEGTFRSENGGASWTSSHTGASAALGVSGIHATDGHLLVGTSIGLNWGHGIWRTEDHGVTWQLSSHPQFRPTTFYEYGDELLAGGSGSPRGVARSADGGANWTVSNSGMSPSTILYDLFENDGVLLAAGHDALYHSTDGGYNWTAAGPQGIRSFARHGNVLFAAHPGAGAFRSTDGGQSWTPFAQGLTGYAMKSHSVLVHERRVYLGTDGLGVWRLDGDQWTHIGPGPERVTSMVGVDGGLIIGTRTAPYLWTWSANAGWEPFDQGLLQRRVDVLVRHGSNLYVGLPLGGLWHRRVPTLVASNQAGVPDVGPTVQPAVVGVYPNPATTSAVIAVELGEGGAALVQLLDVLGREVIRWDIPDDRTGLWQQSVDTSRLAAGLYLVRATVNGNTVVHRLTVTR